MNDSDLVKLVRAASGTVDPCSPSIDWLAGLPAGTTPEQAWGLCPDATWMFWIARKIWIDKVLIVLSACDIAESVLDLVPSGEDRPRLAIETARAWARGEATLEDVRKASRAADANADAYADAYAASYADAYAASYAAYATSRANSLSRSADLIRVRIPWSLVAERLAAIGVAV